jgi:hypothetical protein
MIARIKFWLALRKRKQARLIEQDRARKAYWATVRKAWANDPLRRAV